EHDKPTLLLQLACDKLRREQIVRPGLTRLERLIATAREHAHRETWQRLTPLLPPERQAFLDALLTPEADIGRTRLSWLRQEATAHTAPQIVATLQKIAFLLERGIETWDLAGLNPNRVKWLAQLGWRTTNQHLQRMSPARRYPIPTVSPLIIPLVYSHINGFQRASSVGKPWPGGENRMDGRAAH